MKLMWTIQEIFSKVKYDEHIDEHEEINKMFNCDCEKEGITHEEHVAMHMEYRLRKGMLTPDQAQRFEEYKDGKK